MKYAVLILMLSLSCANVAQAVTINGQDINEVLRSNQVLVYDNTHSQGISLSADAQGNVAIGSMRLTPECERYAFRYYTELEAWQDRMSQNRGKALCFRSSKSMHHEGAYIEGVESIALSSGTSLAFSNSILRSVDVYLEAPSIAFVDTFVDADTITLASTSPDALIESISIFFERESGIVPLVVGAIDFKANEIMGSVRQGMTIVGVRKVVISFAPHAFAHIMEDMQDAQPCEQVAIAEEIDDEAELLNEMAMQEQEVRAMQERAICAQEIRLFETVDDEHPYEGIQDNELRTTPCAYADELPMDDISCDLAQEVRCSCTAGKDGKEDVPPVTKLQEHEALPEAKVTEAELSAPAYAPLIRACCRQVECAAIESAQQECNAHKDQKAWFSVLTGPTAVIIGVVAAGLAVKYVSTYWLASLSSNSH